MILDFGIPELDALFGKFSNQPSTTQESGMYANPSESLSVSIVGADGTGKSVLALHLASRYASRYKTPVLYFSEDLGFKRADSVFNNFGLNKPKKRCEKLNIPHPARSKPTVKLEPASQDESALLDAGKVHFFDLQTRTEGDDWSYVLSVVANLPKPTSDLACVIIDNVDALQNVNAGLDQFGEERSRWSRLDQLMSLAKNRCHLVFISGEPASGSHLDEQYAADYVLHLFVRSQGLDYDARMLEIEKARGQINVRGKHTFSFRNGRPTTTGYQTNPDFPEIINDGKHLSYMRVFHSLDYLYSQFMASSWSGNQPSTEAMACFSNLSGLNDLLTDDGMCGGTVTAIIGPRQTFKRAFVTAFECSFIKPEPRMVDDFIQGQGLLHRDISNTITNAAQALTKDELVLAGVDTSGTKDSITPETLSQKYAEYYAEIQNAERSHASGKGPDGAPFFIVHLTTEDVDSWQVANRLSQWLSEPEAAAAARGKRKPIDKAAVAYIESRLLCRRLEIHTNSPALLYSMIKDCVDYGLKRVFPDWDMVSPLKPEWLKRAGRVLVSIGDWSQIEERYPEIGKDTKFLPLLLFYFRRRGVTTLISESRADSSALPSVYQSRSHLAQDADQAIYTWRVPGDSRVAIAVVPQKEMDGRMQVREVRADSRHPYRITIDPSLERYEGFESGNPRPVRLRLKLLGQTPGQRTYATEMGKLFEELSEGERTDTPLVDATEEMENELLRDVIYLLGDTRLPYTQLVMIDEFWEAKHSLHDLTSFLQERPEGEPVKSFFSAPRQEEFNKADIQINLKSNKGPVDSDPYLLKARSERLPYTWDFGFILSRPIAWRNAYNELLPSASLNVKTRSSDAGMESQKHKTDTRYEPDSIRTLAELLRFAKRKDGESLKYNVDNPEKYTPDPFHSKSDSGESSQTSSGPYGRPVYSDYLQRVNESGIKHRDYLSWRVFLEACCLIARHSTELKLRPFDIDLTAPETLTCTVLEIWLSELKYLIELKPDGLNVPLPGFEKQDDKAPLPGDAARGGQSPDEPQPAEFEPSTKTACNAPAESQSDQAKRFLKSLNDSMPEQPSLPEMLENEYCKVALYFTLQFLSEVFDPDMLKAVPSGFDIAPRRPVPAVAVRHWYATAVRAAQEDDVSKYEIIRLPGSYSTRGDWHLAVAKGSKSLRLAYDALDKLSSVRANFDRMQMGVGLPTRKMPEPAFIRTALATIDRPTVMPNYTYENLVSLGATDDGTFDWLFRSRLKNYRFHSTPFRRWVFRVLRQWVQKRTKYLTEWNSSFVAYDEFIQTGFPEKPLQDYDSFKTDVNRLIEILNSTHSTDDRSS